MLYYSAPMTVMRYRGEKKKFAATEATRVAKYDQYIEDKINYIEKLANEQIRILNDEQPSTVRCADQVESVSRTLWDRKRRHRDFMSTRIGYGTIKAYCFSELSEDEIEKYFPAGEKKHIAIWVSDESGHQL